MLRKNWEAISISRCTFISASFLRVVRYKLQFELCGFHRSAR